MDAAQQHSAYRFLPVFVRSNAHYLIKQPGKVVRIAVAYLCCDLFYPERALIQQLAGIMYLQLYKIFEGRMTGFVPEQSRKM